MFAPEGYIPLKELIDRFFWECPFPSSSPDHIGRPLSEARLLDSLAEIHEWASVSVLTLEERAWSNWLMIYFVKRFSSELRICLPTGSLVKPVSAVFSWDGEVRYWQRSDDSIIFPNMTSFEIREDFPDFYEGRVWLAEIDFYCVDMARGSVKKTSDLRRMAKALGRSHDDFREIYALQNCPICISQGAIPVPLDDLSDWLREQINSHWKGFNCNARFSNYGRNLANQIANDVMKNGITKGQAKAKYAPGEKVETWKAIWAEVVEIHPDASRPGPRRKQDQSGSSITL